MGTWTDYYRPDSTVSNTTFSYMVTTQNNANLATQPSHKWANNYNNPFVIPRYYDGHNLGSATSWPNNNVPGDGRAVLNFLGMGIGWESSLGGCCYGGSGGWMGQSYTAWVKEGIADKKAADCNTLQNSFVTPANAPSGKYVMSDNSKAYCGMNVANSCLDWYNKNYADWQWPTMPNQVYWINPTRSTGQQFQAYCDMTSGNGGWTLVMKQKANDGVTLQGDTAYWTNYPTATLGLNETVSNRSLSDDNFISYAFTRISPSQLRLTASNEASDAPGNANYKTITGSSAYYAFGSVTQYSDDFNANRPNWFIHTTVYPMAPYTITSARFEFNHKQVLFNDISRIFCATRWGWTANNATEGAPGSHDACGGLGAYGERYGANQMNNNKNAWQPGTLYLWAR